MDASAEPEDRGLPVRERRRREILEAATRVFAERGYHAAGVSDIIDEAGIARGTFYLYFTGKHSVFAAILDEALAALRSLIEPIRVGDDAPPPRGQLGRQITRLLGFVMGQRSLCQLILEHGLAPDDEVAERIRAFYAHVAAMIEASLGHGIAMGLVRDCDVSLVAGAILGAVRGVVARLLAAPRPPDLDKVAAELLEFALHGVLVPERG